MDFSKAKQDLGLRWQAYRVGRDLRRPGQLDLAVKEQQETLAWLLEPMSRAKRYRELALSPDMPSDTFCANVPLSTADDLAPWVERAFAGEAGVLWPGRCRTFARTAGTASGAPRLIPVTASMQEHFLGACRQVFLQAIARAENRELAEGRLLLLGGNTLHPPTLPPGTNQGTADPLAADLATLAMLLRPDWIAHDHLEPSAKIALDPDWHQMVARIMKRTYQRPISALVGQPRWLSEFGQLALQHLSQGKLRYTSLKAIWPELRFVFHSGSTAETHGHDLRRLAGDGVQLHEFYAAAEGIYAAQGLGKAPGMRLLYDQGLYFEFLPLADYDPTKLAHLGKKTVDLTAVTTETDYLLVVSSPAGLLRQVVGDIVRFESIDPPRLRPIGQIDNRLTSFGENMVALDLTLELSALCRTRKWQLSYFHVAPMPFASDLGNNRGCHEWWIELKAGTRETPTGPVLAAELDRRLQRNHDGYAAARDSGDLDAPVVRLVMPGAFEHWMRHTGRWGGPHKLPACRNDRQIAEALMQMARFHID